MRNVLHSLLREPVSGGALELLTSSPPEQWADASDVREGVLLSTASGKAYPVVDGVPIMLEGALTAAFVARHASAIASRAEFTGLALQAGPHEDWSFSQQWDEHFASNNERTWGYTVQERLEQLYMETDSTPEWFRGKVVLDAGCGDGRLATAVSDLGATVVGLDLSSSVRSAERHRRSAAIHFVQGDLQAPPFAGEQFDLAFSIGVLHHTADTLRTFRSVARLVKHGGKFYVWLYRRPERLVGRFLKVPAYNLARAVISRCSPGLRRVSVGAYARLVRATHAWRGKGDAIPLSEYVVSAYDDLTPRWRHCHTAIEVSRWFHECGFAAPLLSHWDNPFGFGLVAIRNGRGITPGIHYGTGAKLWDASQSVLGRLHGD